MGEHLLHSLIPAADHRFDGVELTMVHELHAAAPARSIPLIGRPAAPPSPLTCATGIRFATFESFVISAADDVAVTFVDERVG